MASKRNSDDSASERPRRRKRGSEKRRQRRAEADAASEEPRRKRRKRKRKRRPAEGESEPKRRVVERRIVDGEEVVVVEEVVEEIVEEVDGSDGGKETKLWEDFRDYFLSFDRRTLGVARIFLGLFAIFDLLRRTADWWKMYSNEGVLPTHYNLWRPQSGGWSFFNAFGSREETWALWALGMFIFTCLLLGYKTRLMQVLAAIYVASMNGRVLLIENGGYVVHNLLFLWTAFLPLGDRFSLDAMLTSMRNQRERSAGDLNDRSTDVAPWRLRPHVSLLGLVLVLQLAAIYGFNVVHKTGPAWHNGTAVHFVMYVDRMVTPLIGETRAYLPFFVYIMLTKMVMGMEAGLPVALLSPLARVWAKRVAIVFVNLLHIGFGSTFVLGPFAWALCCFSTLLISREDWELGERTMKRKHRARVVHYHPGSEWAFFWCRVLKRCDRFELLTFEPDTKSSGLEASKLGGPRLRGVDAAADIIATLPGGPILGWPMRLPPFRQLAQLKGMLFWPLGRFLGFADERGASEPTAASTAKNYRSGADANEWEAAKVEPVTGFVPETRDDDGKPRIDSYFMRDWFREHYGGVVGPIGFRFALVFAGAFAFVYGTPMLRRSDIDANDIILWGAEETAFTLDDGLYWGGLILLLAGLLLFFKPFMAMNLTTPSTPKRKWLRVGAGVREVLVAMFFCGAINQALVELWVARPLKLPQPSPVRELSHKMRYLQGWFMFSPNPVMDDGVIVVDAITVDGRRIDPFRHDTYDYVLGPPDFNLIDAKSYDYNQIWSDYFNRMHLPANTSFRKPMKEYMFRLPERTGNPKDAIVKGTVYWVHDMNPKWGTTNSWGYGRKELFKFTNPDSEVQKLYHELTGGQDPPPAPTPLDSIESQESAENNEGEAPEEPAEEDGPPDREELKLPFRHTPRPITPKKKHAER